MNNHKKFEELLQGYLDNTLNSKEKEVFNTHLKSCKRCETKFKERKNLIEKIRSAKEEIQCPDYLIGNILKNTTEKQSGEIISSKTIRWRYLAVGAAAILIVVSTILVNNIDNQTTLTTKYIREKQKGESLSKETEIVKVTEGALDKQARVASEKKKTTVEKTLKPLIEPKAASPETKTDFAEVKKREEVILSENIVEHTKNKDIKIEAPMLSRAAKPTAPGETAAKQPKETQTFGFASEIDKEETDFTVFEDDLSTGGISESHFEETRFVFPEEGSIVGKDFEIVIILKDPAEKIEIILDGEKITNYTKTTDSNIIFIGSDSFPPLEEGLHFLSVLTTTEKSLTFYKEG